VRPKRTSLTCVSPIFIASQELGWYDPIKKQSNLNAPAIKAWLAKGAQPSETVGALLRKSLIMEKK
jgi:ribosomal protein S16